MHRLYKKKKAHTHKNFVKKKKKKKQNGIKRRNKQAVARIVNKNKDKRNADTKGEKKKENIINHCQIRKKEKSEVAPLLLRSTTIIFTSSIVERAS